MKAIRIEQHPIHLGSGATALVQPEFTGSIDWYKSYSKRSDGDGVEGRLVSMHSFSESWDVWEMHPLGSEVVLCTAGTLTLHQELPDGARRKVVLHAGEYAINDAGTWHTADVLAPATALFITAGLGTQHRPRQN